MKKGFTLIELLAVIVILAIIALIATPMILGVIETARKGAAKSSALGYIDAVEKQMMMNQVDDDSTNDILNGEYTLPMTGISVKGELPESGWIKIENGKIADYSIKVMEYTVNKDEEPYKDEEKQEDVPQEPTYAAYSVGDDVTLNDGTTWIVVKDTTTNESEIKIMATSNIKSNLTTETGTDMFSDEATIAYDSSSNKTQVWRNSTLKKYLDTTVKTKLEASLNTTISDITIWGVVELTALGCTVTGNSTNGYSSVICDETKAWHSKVFNSTSAWTKLPYPDASFFTLFVYGSDSTYAGKFIYNIVYRDDTCGARPIITISKSAISQ